MARLTGFAEVNGTVLYYEAAGSGPPVVFVHGFGLDRRMWDDQFEIVALSYLAVRYDARGFGLSAAPSEEPYGHAEDLRALLDHLGLERASIVGLSMGGGIALDFAIAYPAAVDRLILVDSTLDGYEFAAPMGAFLRSLAPMAQEEGVQAARERWLAHEQFAPARERPGVTPRLAEIVGGYSGWHWLDRDPGRGLDPPAARRLSEVQAPTLVLVGERDLPDFQTIADILARGIPGARKAVIPGVGHMANMEAPLTFTDHLVGFLEGP